MNGLTNEALLAILVDRTKKLDALFACDENKRAISHMEEALVNLEVRTARRMVRGVEGKEVPLLSLAAMSRAPCERRV